jgi:hypothetical protein
MMPILKTFLIILGLFLPFVTMAADNSIMTDSEKPLIVGKTFLARVIAPKAIVYADENLLTPLGYLPNGKRLIVGNPRKINPNLVPMVVYGRIGFVEIKDLRYDDEEEEEYNSKRGAPKEHDVDITIKGADEKLSENNSAYISLHRYSVGSEVQKMFLAIDNSDVTSTSGFHSQFIHRQSASKFFWGAGLDYSSTSSNNAEFAYWLLSPTVGYTLLNNPLFKLEVYGSFDLALNVLLDIKNNFQKEPAGYAFGPQLNARFILFPNAKWHAFGGLGYRNYTITNLRDLRDADLNPLTGIEQVVGASLFLGLGIQFE